MIPANELAALRATATSALDISGILVQRATLTDDGYGLQTQVWSTIATVSGSEAKPSAAVMQQYASKIGALASWVVRLPYAASATARAGDRLVLPSGDMRIVQADLSDSSYSTCLLYLVSEVRP